MSTPIVAIVTVSAACPRTCRRITHVEQRGHDRGAGDADQHREHEAERPDSFAIRNAPSSTIEPCAKLMTRLDLKITTKPSATSAYTNPSEMPLISSSMNWVMPRPPVVGGAPPRYASITAGSLLDLGRRAVGDARPKSRTVTRSASPMTNAMSCSTRTIEMPELGRGRPRSPAPSAASPRRSCRPPARRAAAASAPRTARGPARRACGRRRTAPSPAAPAAARARAAPRSRARARLLAALAARGRQPEARARRSPPSSAGGARAAGCPRTVAVGDSAMFWNVRLMPSAAISVRAQPGQRAGRRSARCRRSARRRP